MAKYDAAFKIKVAQEAAQGTTSGGEVAMRHGLDYSMVRRWRDAYLLHGRAGLSRKHTYYDVSFKMEVLQRIKAEGLSLRQATALFNVRNAGLIGTWQRQY
ncbi:helix-turn-helix domain-containing protein, partial [Luteibacter sp. 22Crub2.1]|uniref:helix-turn-helix domain-containing protein n=1 Tax=Luteibacter sp. 22Crub2.1 TaxID=1283288 RepID=UPI001116330C